LKSDSCIYSLVLTGFDTGFDELTAPQFVKSIDFSLLAQKWAVAQASMPIKRGGMLAKKEVICERLSCC